MARPRFQADARAWLAAAALVGLGQQVFVVLRNTYLADRSYSPTVVTSVQGAGAAAGVVAGLVGLWALRRWPARLALGIGVTANAVGFGIQVVATSPAAFVFGAAIAGLGIQGITMSAAPFLARTSTVEERVLLFGIHTIAIQAGPGAIGALLGGQIQRAAASALGSTVGGYRIALAAGALSVASAWIFLFRVRERRITESTSAPSGLFRLREPRRALALLAPDALVFFGSGLTVPFLQLYFKDRFGLAPASVGAIYAAMMFVGGAGHVLSPRLAARFGTPKTILATQLLSLPFFAELLFAHEASLAIAAFVLRQAMMNMSLPLYGSFLHTSVVDEDSGPVASYRMIAQSVAWAAANFVAGPLMAADAGGFRYVIAATMATYVAAIAVGAIVYPRFGREPTGSMVRGSEVIARP